MTATCAIVFTSFANACGETARSSRDQMPAQASTSEGGQGTGGADSNSTTGAELTGGDASSLPSCEGIPPYGMAWENGICAVPGQRCLCPDDRRSPECQDIATCGPDSTWEVEMSDCPLPEPEQCPNDPLELRDQLCTTEGRSCLLVDPSLACYCVNASSVGRDWIQSCFGYPPIWYCGESQTGCPEGVPEIGSPCPEEGVRCGNACWNSLARECSGGVWVEGVVRGECI